MAAIYNKKLRQERTPYDFFGPRYLGHRVSWDDPLSIKKPFSKEKKKYVIRHCFEAPGCRTVRTGALKLDVEEEILPNGNYPRITNYVVTAHFGLNGKNLLIDQRQITLRIPNAVRNDRFAAVIIPQDFATVLFFANCKIVLTGKTTPESALFALQMYKIKLGMVPQPILLCDNLGSDSKTNRSSERIGLCYLKTILGFSGFGVQNTVGSGPITREGETVNLAAFRKSFPETNWNPQIFPGLKFLLPPGNNVIPGGHKCTAHIFESKIVLMGPKKPKYIKIAYDYFLRLVKNFLIRSTTEYEEDPYSYRYHQMMNIHFSSSASPHAVNAALKKNQNKFIPDQVDDNVKKCSKLLSDVSFKDAVNQRVLSKLSDTLEASAKIVNGYALNKK